MTFKDELIKKAMQTRIAVNDYGEVAEWFNAAVLKTVEGASPPRVRISASPPNLKPVGMTGFFY